MDDYSALLTSLVKEARDFAPPRVTPRDDVIRSLPEPAPFNMVHIITGVRRCGKTFYAFQLMRKLVEDGFPRERVFYFNFADERLNPAPRTLIGDVLDEYWRQVPEARAEGAYLFLDEVQEAGAWQAACQRIAEHEVATLVVTGSSSKLSSDEIATTFRGRSHAHEMAPLSFREFCRFNGIRVPPAGSDSAFSPQERTALESAFDRYLVEGGFPGVVSMGPEDRIEVLQGYVRDVVARDVAERSGREEISLANRIALFALRNTACELSVNNLVEQMRAYGYKTYWDKVKGLLDLFGQSYLVAFVREYSAALREGSTAVEKVYAVDQGAAFAVSRATQQDIGKRFETAAYMELRRRCAGRRTETITSLTVPGTLQQKVDFVVGDAMGAEPYRLIQACVSMSAEKTRAREVGSLEAGMCHARLPQGEIVTLRDRETIETEAGTIEVVPAWQWFLRA